LTTPNPLFGIPLLNQRFGVQCFWVIVRSAGPGITPCTLVMGLVGVVLLTSLLFGLRGVVMFPPEPVQIKHHPAAHSDSDRAHEHQGHCPLCFLQMLLPTIAPEQGVGQVATFALQIWLGESRAKDEFLRAVTARGPPNS
jgi:hypothetical protein